ncbi:hypothetical protein QWZ10_02595 [Paracoccus cavernae]|uniref:Uncharacterized protein n=2 Tax=Paracoccus cavernae TaxID=1571207 RepID=A0ABT8D3C6_9RHOB|nr:hypothetical protein [Paracoccus cavernae]
MTDMPLGDAGAPVATELVSLFQTGAVGFRALRTLSWRRRRAAAVQWMAVKWGEPDPAP